LKRCKLLSFAIFLLLAPAVRAQSLPATPSVPGMPPVPTSLEDRRKALAQVSHDYWEDVLKRSPELASAVGDARYNDQVTNLTARAYNDALAREQNYLMQVAVIDEAGFSDEEKQLEEALDKRLEDDLKAADAKPWETPIFEGSSFFDVYWMKLPQVLTFTSAKNYDDWTSRLHMLPEMVAQAMQDMSLGIDDSHVPPKDDLDKALAEVTAMAAQKPEDSPLAAPLKKFPSNVSAAEQDRIKQEMTDAVSKDAVPTLLRLQRFLQVSYLPAAGNNPVVATRDAQLLGEVLDLRIQAQQAQGAKFDLKAFHDEILKTGLLPIDQMRMQVLAWMGK
jgi:uncharacterized protein (DUF885 family)